MSKYNLFTYGTLIIPEVMQLVAGTVFESQTATLTNYQRFLVKNQVFPAITKATGNKVSGKVYLDVDSDSLSVIDIFESIIYNRLKLDVLTDTGSTLEAYAYVIKDDKKNLLSDQPWNELEFRNYHLQKYLARIQG